QLGGFGHAELVGPCDERAVARHLVMLDGLTRGDHAGIAHGPRPGLAHDLLPLLDQALDGLAGLAAGRPVHEGEDALQALDLALRLLEMVLERAPELAALGVLGHPGQRFHDLLLTVIDVLERGQEQVFELGRGHVISPAGVVLSQARWVNPSVAARVPSRSGAVMRKVPSRAPGLAPVGTWEEEGSLRGRLGSGSRPRRGLGTAADVEEQGLADDSL